MAHIKTIWGTIQFANEKPAAFGRQGKKIFSTIWGRWIVTASEIKVSPSQAAKTQDRFIYTFWGIVRADYIRRKQVCLKRQRSFCEGRYFKPFSSKKPKNKCLLCGKMTFRKCLCPNCQVETRRMRIIRCKSPRDQNPWFDNVIRAYEEDR